MQSLIDHARTFPAKIADQQQQFAELARGQQPQALFIACSDSRVMPSLFTGARPGEIFELRTAGNIVPPHRPRALCAVAGTVEFALEALDVPDIVVCGHTHCGAVGGLIRPQTVRTMPLVARWLTGAGHRPVDEDPDTVARRHLLTQLDHLRTYPGVARRLAAGKVRLHAWFYAIETGELLAHDPDAGEFRRL